jgi:hypothetical protein
VYLVLYLGPSTAAENLAVLRRQSAGAAMVFSPRLIEQSLNMLVSISAYLGALLPALGYGLLLALPRRRASHQWAIIWLLASLNLVWYVVASVGWWRYAFLGLALASLFIARLFADLAGAFRLRWPKTLLEVSSPGTVRRRMVGLAMSGWLAAMILIPLGQTVYELVRPEFNAPMAMAHYMDEHVSSDALVESWEPEMGFLTNHNYHFPPAPLLTDAVSQVSLGGPPVATLYDFVQTQAPEYVLQGPFARGVGLYPAELLKQDYRLVTQIGAYDLYQRSK